VRNILIHGIGSVLACHFAGRCLGSSIGPVYYFSSSSDVLSAGEIANLVAHVAQQAAAQGQAVLPDIQESFLPIRGEMNASLPGICVDEAWYFVDSATARDRTELQDIIFTASAMGAKEFNYVEFNCAGESGSGNTPAKEVEAGSTAHGLRYRIFRTSLVIGDGKADSHQPPDLLSNFLSVLHSFKAELEERCPNYFDYHALRYMALANSAVNLVPAAAASDLLLKLSRAEGTANAGFWIASPGSTSLAELCDNLGMAYNLGLTPATNPEKLNAVDRAFLAELDESQHRAWGVAEPARAEIFQLSNLPQETAVVSAKAQRAFFESVRRRQDQALARRKRAAKDLPNNLESKTILRNGSELRYFFGGKQGSAVVILNALGQGLEYWYRLLACLIEHHRVFIWEPRGTTSPAPPVGITDQVDDVEAVLREQGIEICHFIGWCTGPKVAIDFHLRRPSVARSMVFLNGTLKCDGSPAEMDSPYEHNLESLCRLLVKKPAMAPFVRKTLNSREEANETEILKESDREKMSTRVLSLMNVDLRARVVAPFQTAETTLNYANQLVDFWSNDARPKASQVQVPVLLLSAEYDQVATPESSSLAAELFPWARHVHVKGATHYCLYDRPEFVAGLLTRFFAAPEAFVAQAHEPAYSATA
jgi:pimeloyl-ACP methyl ester carboxylesterase